MRRKLMPVVVLGMLTVVAVVARDDHTEGGFSPYVDATGAIQIPEEYREWRFLGSWHIAPERGVDDTAGVAGFHNVYTQPGTIERYRQTGEFPDGAVIVKELLASESGQLTTGEVGWATEIEGWFVMVKDTENRFPENPRWGGGWGWVLFNADDPERTVTRNWRMDCLGCHAPARDTDWVFVDGYPVLQQATPFGSTASRDDDPSSP